MSISIIGLITLFVVVAVGFVKKLNVGLLAIAAGVVLGYASGMFSSKAIVSGFSASLFMTLLGVTFLFGLVQLNGCLELLMKKLIAIFGKQIWMIPILMYVMGWTMSAMGPGCVPTLAFVAVIALPLAHQTGYSPIMLMLIGDIATYSGRFTALTPEGVLVTKLLSAQGLDIPLTSIVLNTGVGSLILSVIFFLFYKGYKVKHDINSKVDHEVIAVDKFNIKHHIALAGIAMMVAGVIFLKMDVGLASFVVAMVLILLGVGDEKAVLKTIPWGTLIMVCGVGVLMNLVIGTGGIKLLAGKMAEVMTPGTAAAVAGLTAGVMSWFSSTIGVVLPTLLPTVGALLESLGKTASPVEIVSAICLISSCAGFSPASTVGALIMASVESDSKFNKVHIPQKLFVELFAWSVFCVIFLALLALAGLFRIF